MGYCMSQQDCHILIKQENKTRALQAIQEFAKGKKLMWVSSEELQEMDSLEDVLEDMRWEATVDDFGNITKVDFWGEKLGDETKLFNSIAPFVEDGSYIEMSGEDGDLWRWVFKNNECTWVNPKIIWE